MKETEKDPPTQTVESSILQQKTPNMLSSWAAADYRMAPAASCREEARAPGGRVRANEDGTHPKGRGWGPFARPGALAPPSNRFPFIADALVCIHLATSPIPSVV